MLLKATNCVNHIAICAASKAERLAKQSTAEALVLSGHYERYMDNHDGDSSRW